MSKSTVKRIGPKVEIEVVHLCTGCQFHSIENDDMVEGRKHHTCNHPDVVRDHTVPQWMGLAHDNRCKTPPFLCPFLKSEGP